MLIKIFLGFFLIALTETINGMFRVKVLQKLSKKYAKTISFLLGSFAIIVLNLLLLPWIQPLNLAEAFFVGFIWGLLMIYYDIIVGKVLFKLSFERIMEDFNIFKGNLLSLGILLIMILPAVLFKLGYLE